MSLMREDLAAAGKIITGRKLVSPSFAGIVAPPATALSRLRNLHEAAGHLARACSTRRGRKVLVPARPPTSKLGAMLA